MQSQYKIENYCVENFYALGNLAQGLEVLAQLNQDSQFRLVVVADTNDELDSLREVTAQTLGCYLSFFLSSDPELIEDIKSQCRANNFFWLVNDTQANQIRQAGLGSSELTVNGQDIETLGSINQKNHYHQLRLTFRKYGTEQQRQVRFDIGTSLVAQKWARACRYDYLDNNRAEFEKNFMLQNWQFPTDSQVARNIPVLCAELNKYINTINAYFDGSDPVKRPFYHISQFFDPVTLDQDILNEIHHHFELLIGQVWNPAQYFLNATLPVMFAIRQLNNLCHEMEGMRQQTLGQAHWSAYVFFPAMPVVRYKFIESDYDNYTQFENFGDIFLHYCQLGKTPLEAFHDNDDVIHTENITGLRYLSGEFNVFLNKEYPQQAQANGISELNSRLYPWLSARGIDPNSKFTGIGKILVAKLVRTDWPTDRIEDILSDLFNYDDIYKIELLDSAGNTISSKLLDYTWRDQVLRDETRLS